LPVMTTSFAMYGLPVGIRFPAAAI
jgi:hypothetical protein